MIRFLLRRLMIMVPSLIGITLATLLLLDFLPGDAATIHASERRGGYTAADLEKIRRAFSLHLPLLFNPTPEDARDADVRLLQGLRAGPGERGEALRTLTERGAIALNAIIPLLEASDDAAKSDLLLALEPVARRRERGDALSASLDPVAFWREEAIALSSEESQREVKLRRAVEKLRIQPDQEASATIAFLDTYALPVLMESLETDLSSEAVLRFSAALQNITGTEMSFQEGTTDQEALSRWRRDWSDWWRARESDYVVLEGVPRLLAHVTQTRYALWLGRLLHLDFGRSSQDHRPIREKLGERLNVTLTLSLVSLILSYLISVPLGIHSAVKFHSLSDRVVTLILFILFSLPTFWVAVLMQQFLCGVDPRGFNLFPLKGLGVTRYTFSQLLSPETAFEVIWHLVLPVAILTYRNFASLSRYQRTAMLEVIRQDYIRTARAKGLRERTVIFRHALRNALLPLMTLIGLQLPSLIGGTVIVEPVFQLNGMGSATLEAILLRDVNWIMAAVTLTAFITMLGVLFADVACALVDPRIRLVAADRPVA